MFSIHPFVYMFCFVFGIPHFWNSSIENETQDSAISSAGENFRQTKTRLSTFTHSSKDILWKEETDQCTELFVLFKDQFNRV